MFIHTGVGVAAARKVFGVDRGIARENLLRPLTVDGNYVNEVSAMVFSKNVS